jgi:N-glycosidase YbiA
MPTDPPAVPADHRILYFRRDREAFGFLSHFHPSPFELDGEVWPTVEHYFQAQRSFDPAYRQAIRDAATPGQAKQLAAYSTKSGIKARVLERSWFHQNGAMPRPDWSEVERDIMRRADRAKFAQNPGLADALRATGDAELIEDSPFEPFWGIGHDGAGQNWAGRILMEVRASLFDSTSHVDDQK